MENKNKIIIVIIIIVALLSLVIIYGKQDKKEETKSVKEDLLKINYDIDGNENNLDNYDTSNPVVAMYIKKYGSIVIELYPDIAPNTVNNFIYLVRTGFYDKNTIHRLDKDFVIQGGDPKGLGSGGPDYTIKGEFSENGFENNLKHKKKVVSMARSEDNDSAGSQFFIMLKDNSYLDGKYASFGKIIDGWDNIENIVNNEEVEDITTGKLKNNLKIVKAIVDTKGKTYNEPEKIEK